MRIALDATSLDEPTTGIGLYARELHRALLARGATVERWGARTGGEEPRGALGKSRWMLTRVPGLLASRRPDVLHAVANINLPLQRSAVTRLVLTVHDLIPLLLPDTVSTAFRWQFRLWLARSLRVADQVICVSHSTRDGVLAHFEVEPSRVQVVHHGVDHLSRVPPADAITRQWLRALNLPPSWVLYAGALDARKNVELVLEAVARLHRGGRRVALVLAGQRWFGAGAIERRAEELRREGVDIRPLGYLSEPVFYEVMRQASVLVFPSRHEGFGLPPLEAMALGVPTVVSTRGALPEVCGEGAQYVDPDDAQGLARTLERLLASDEERRRWGEAGRRRAATFTWEACARDTLAVYRRALEVPR